MFLVGAFIIERIGTDLDDVLSKLEQNDRKWRANIYVIHQVIGIPDEYEAICARIIAVSETLMTNI